jgi:hypothetical protein
LTTYINNFSITSAQAAWFKLKQTLVSSTTTVTNWVFDHPKYSLPINAEQSFRVTLSWRGGLPTALATNWIVEVHLLGILVGFIDRL